MLRRTFLQMSVSALAAGATAGCVGVGASAAAGARLDAAAFHAARQYAQTRFGRIAYIDRGHGKAALFLHGFPLNAFQWRGAIERLSPYRRCIAPDFMGLGFTEAAAGQSVTPEAQVDMLVALLDALAVESADVVANDSGGQAAQILLARYPKRVRTLLLTNCDAENDSPPAALAPVIALSREGRFVDQWLAPWRANTALARSAEGIGGMCYADPAHPTDEAIEYYFAPLMSAQQKALTHAYAVALERNPLVGVGPALKRSRAPTRIVWGTGDTIFSRDSPEFLNRAFGGSRGVRLLEGRKLFWPEELPDVVAEEARALWSI
jgi:pimeloyl-ACP methyl ester carboxylesterase